MDEFLIPCAAGRGGLLFFDRTPVDPDEAVGNFWVRVTNHHLSAAAKVWAGCMSGHPLTLFKEMGRLWRGWPDELTWESMEGELVLRCRQDRSGHVEIRVELRSGCMDDDWRVAATIMAESGRLEGLARRAELFFGREW